MSQDRKEELTALESELAQMAQDVPDMPDDFHARWTQQIREQAAQEQTASRQENRRQWRYVLSAAAVFVFLIGGTLITRRSGNTNLMDSGALGNTAQPQETVSLQVNAKEAADEAVYDAAVYESAVYEEAAEAAEEAAYAVTGAAEEPASAAETNGVFMFAAKTASAARTEEAAAGAAYEAEEADMAVYADAAEDMAAYEEEAVGGMMEEAAEEAAEPAPAPESAPEAAPAEEETAKDETGDAGEEKTESEFVSFLKDLGNFTLRMLPILLLALFAVLFGGRLKNRKK